MAGVSSLLLLIDLQVSFCDETGSMARQGRDITALQTAARRCDALAVAAREATIPVVWTRMVFRPDYSDGGWLTTDLRPNLVTVGALRAGSGDEELSSLVAPADTDIVIDKPRYSSLYGTPLEVILRSRGIDHVIVAGITTQMCVESTVRDISQRDYKTTVVEDACAEFSRERHDASIAAMEFGFARIVSSEDTRRLFAGGGSND